MSWCLLPVSGVAMRVARHAVLVDVVDPRQRLLFVSPRAVAQEVVVLDNKAAQESTTAILQDHSIPSLVSKDLLDVLPESLRNPARAEAAVAAVTA